MFFKDVDYFVVMSGGGMKSIASTSVEVVVTSLQEETRRGVQMCSG